jgi:RNA-binding protein 8A
MSWRHHDGEEGDDQPADDQRNMKLQGAASDSTCAAEGDGDYTQQDSPQPRGSGPQKSIEGWIIFITGLHEDTDEDDLVDAFSEYGKVQHVSLNRDRQTGLCKGYALVEYGTFTEAQDTINALHGTQVMGRQVGVDWAFVKPTGGHRRGRR